MVMVRKASVIWRLIEGETSVLGREGAASYIPENEISKNFMFAWNAHCPLTSNHEPVTMSINPNRERLLRSGHLQLEENEIICHTRISMQPDSGSGRWN
jgi:hypothetical protein